MIYYVVATLFVLICFLLLIVVLLQQGKGGDIAAAFGGGGGTQTAFGARAGATVLTRATTVLGALFMILALLLAIVGQRGPGSVVGGVEGPASTSAPAQPAPPPQQPPSEGQGQGQAAPTQPAGPGGTTSQPEKQ